MTRAKAIAAAGLAVVLLVVVAVLAVLGVGSRPTVEGTAQAMPTDPIVTARDGAVDGASTSAVALTSVDNTDPEGAVSRMEQASTGKLLDEFRAKHAQWVTTNRNAGMKVTTRVLMAAATQVDPAGTASVLVVVVGDYPNAQAKQSRLRLEMSRTPQGWKAAAVSAVPVG